MTLTKRNHFFLGLHILFGILVIIIAVLFFAAYTLKAIYPPPVIQADANASLKLFRYSFKAVVLSIAVFMVFASLGTFLVYRNFEKTQSNEIFFFSGFFICCMTESMRLLIPLFGLWQSYSPLFLFIGRAVFFGRMLFPLCFLFSATMSSSDQSKNIERNYTIMLAVTVVFAAIMPLNTVVPTGLCTIYWGFPDIFALIRGIFLLLAVVSMLINAHQHESPELRQAAAGLVILIIGYTFLTHADTFFKLIIGTVCLAAGCYQYLAKIHQLYLWK